LFDRFRRRRWRTALSATSALPALPLALLARHWDWKLSGNSQRADGHHHHNTSECANRGYRNPSILYCHDLLPVSGIVTAKNSYILLFP
jgi:hypothetical protein